MSHLFFHNLDLKTLTPTSWDVYASGENNNTKNNVREKIIIQK